MMDRNIRNQKLFILFCVALGGMGQGVVTPKLPEILKQSSELALASGIAATLMYLGIFISTFTYGRLADQGRFHWLLGPGLFVYSASLILIGNLSTPYFVYAATFIEGLSMSAVFVAADFALGRLSNNHTRSQWLSYYGVALSIGLILGPTLSLCLLKIAKSALLPLSVVSVLSIVAGIFAMRLRIAKVKKEIHLKTKMNQGALASGAAYGYMEAAIVAVFPVLAIKIFHVIPETSLILMILAAGVSSVMWGVLSDRMGPSKIVYFLILALIMGSFALIFLDRFFEKETMAYVSAIFFGLLAGGLYPIGFAWLLSSLPQSDYGYASGSFARAYGLGSLLGPLLCGLATENFGPSGFYCAIALAAIVAFFFMLKAQLVPS